MTGELATEKQIGFMQKLGISYTTHTTKEEAKTLISNKLAEEEKPEVVKPYAQKSKEEPKTNIQIVRMSALKTAAELIKERPDLDFWILAERIETWILR